MVLSELPLPALTTEDVQLADAVRHGAPLVVRVLVLARLPLAFRAVEKVPSARRARPTRLRAELR